MSLISIRIRKYRISKAIKKISKESYPIEICTEDFSKDPAFLAKHEMAEKFIAEHGLPEAFKTKPKAKGRKKKSAE
jgi:hypothetical protein